MLIHSAPLCRTRASSYKASFFEKCHLLSLVGARTKEEGEEGVPDERLEGSGQDAEAVTEPPSESPSKPQLEEQPQDDSPSEPEPLTQTQDMAPEAQRHMPMSASPETRLQMSGSASASRLREPARQASGGSLASAASAGGAADAGPGGQATMLFAAELPSAEARANGAAVQGDEEGVASSCSKLPLAAGNSVSSSFYSAFPSDVYHPNGVHLP
jgi:hypothetical protein